ncbi:DUF423 domain-containing protein [Vulgatibacter incomptus]|uniref:DUF423 domain-containing protein n=1 Tax=Vulgatibacter incomptus TaxID=1391653 RepID=A0A0K1PH04_9BACT|nr:DUF423 domain-containing protein [Vulgatibacter incomptus]AKU92795.1 hypothetical protein AKJ08_3182 [Vulgatibacter incomptus]
MHKLWLALGAINALVSVAAGAFGAHGLRQRLGPDLLAIFETGARYQMYHALGLLALGLLVRHGRTGLSTATGWTMFAGIVIFSGSLYLLALTGVRGFGAITPIGGLAFLIAWALFAAVAIRGH